MSLYKYFQYWCTWTLFCQHTDHLTSTYTQFAETPTMKENLSEIRTPNVINSNNNNYAVQVLEIRVEFKGVDLCKGT